VSYGVASSLSLRYRFRDVTLIVSLA